MKTKKQLRLSRSKNTTLTPTSIDYKNLILLRQFISAEGKILSRRITNLSAKEQRWVARAIKQARVMGLLPFVNKKV